MIRLAFNATSLLSPLTGIGQYSRHLALGLAARTDLEPEFFYGTFWSKAVRDVTVTNRQITAQRLRRFLPFSYELRRVAQRYQFTAYCKKRAFDIYHEPNIIALDTNTPTVITVHDLSWIRYPAAHPAKRVRAMNRYFEPGLRRASLILTDSEFVRQEVMDVFGVKPHLVRTVLLGVEALFRPRSSAETLLLLERLGLTHGHYLLAVGTLEPRKNLSVALNAFMKLSPQLRKRFPMVIAGMKGWHTSALEQQIAPLVSSGEIRLLGYLPREDLATVIAGATALVYPSIYEGFGLPPLEAMACAIPVISSNVSSIPEVVGSTGLMLDPQDVDGFSEAMRLVASAPDLRAGMARKALERACQFSWENCVSETVDAYKFVLNSP